MEVTDLDAKTKWCPFVRISTGSHIIVANRNKPETQCKGTGCMAWVAVGTYQHEQTGRCGLVKEGV